MLLSQSNASFSSKGVDASTWNLKSQLESQQVSESVELIFLLI